jgi:hypothetical protein
VSSAHDRRCCSWLCTQVGSRCHFISDIPLVQESLFSRVSQCPSVHSTTYMGPGSVCSTHMACAAVTIVTCMSCAMVAGEGCNAAAVAATGSREVHLTCRIHVSSSCEATSVCCSVAQQLLIFIPQITSGSGRPACAELSYTIIDDQGCKY